MVNRSARGWHRQFLTPTILVLVLTTVAPMIYTIYLSLTSTRPGDLRPSGFAGFANYSRLLHSPTFWHSLWIEIVFVALALAIELFLGFWLALLVNRNLPGITFIRTILLFPIVLPPVVTALLFDYMLQSRVGVISYYLSRLGVQQTWLDHRWTALFVLVGLDVWQFTPFVILLVLAGLQSLPLDVLEAAKMDGASSLQTINRVIVPMLKPVLATILILRFIDAVQVFPTIFVLTAGGPGNATNALNFWGFTVFFQHLDVSYGAAIAMTVTVFTLMVAIGLALVGRVQIQSGGNT